MEPERKAPERSVTRESAELDKYGPQPTTLFIEQGKIKDSPVDGFVVPGTDGVFGVFAHNTQPSGLWQAVHIPTGKTLKRYIANRDTAEGLCCWIYCNAIDPIGLKSDNPLRVQEAFGARVRSAFTQGRPFGYKVRERKKKQHVGTHPTYQPEVEKSLLRRISGLKVVHARNQRLLVQEQKRVDTRDMILTKRVERLDERENDLENAKRRHLRDRDEFENNCSMRREELSEWELTLNDARAEIEKLRNSVIGAIQVLNSDTTDDDPTVRRLRRVKVPTDPPQAAQRESS